MSAVPHMAMIMLQTKSSTEIMELQQLRQYDEKQQPTAITSLHCCSPQNVTKEGYKFTWHHDFQFQYNKAITNHEVTSTNYRGEYL